MSYRFYAGQKDYIDKLNEMWDAVDQAYTNYTASSTSVTEAVATVLGKADTNSPDFTGTPTVPTASPGTNSTQAASTAYVDSAVAAVVNSAPTTLNTLNKLAAALGDDSNLSVTITNELATKADTSALTSHTSNTSNPHSVTKTQVGLSNVDNLSSAQILALLTSAEVTTALGYTPASTAGSTMTGPINFNGQQSQNPVLKSYREAITTANTTASYTVDCSASNIQNLVLAVATTTIAFSNVPAAGVLFNVVLLLKQDGTGSRLVSFPSSVVWSGGTAPTLTTTAGKLDIISMFTVDGGVTWYGSVNGKNF